MRRATPSPGRRERPDAACSYAFRTRARRPACVEVVPMIHPLGRTKMKRLLAVLSFCLVAASCQEGHAVVPNPIAPSPPTLETAPKPPLYPPDSWRLAASVTSVTPHPCFRDLTGLTSN